MVILSDYGAILIQIYYIKRSWKHCNYNVELNIAIYHKSRSLLSMIAHVRPIYIYIYHKVYAKGTMYLDIANFSILSNLIIQ